MKRKNPKLKLATETIRHLDESALREAAGGGFSQLNTCTCQPTLSCWDCTRTTG